MASASVVTLERIAIEEDFRLLEALAGRQFLYWHPCRQSYHGSREVDFGISSWLQREMHFGYGFFVSGAGAGSKRDPKSERLGDGGLREPSLWANVA